MFVHLVFLTGFGNRFSTMLGWIRSMIGRGRAERDFSAAAHTGGDLSLPDQVKREVEPNLYPIAEEADRVGLMDPGTAGDTPERHSPPSTGDR